ncbi:MAG TPA: phage portal protein [Candidatus Megaira endosymbiont of Nemacystus decipiens]|nr:phage portal protein [Candidatus Megaera endosymbiont of Nemacystus decipiens]
MIKSYLRKIRNRYQRKSLSNLNYSFFNNGSDKSVGVDSYLKNVIVHRCVSLIATSASHVPWQVFSTSSTGDKLQPNHPVVKLLKKPSPNSSGADFFIENLSNLLLYGNSYMLIDYDKTNSFYTIKNLHPNDVSELVLGDKNVGYKVISEGKTYNYKTDPSSGISQILHIKNYNPHNTKYGLSCLSSAAGAINLYEKIIQWNKSLLSNASRPSGALVFQDGNGYLTDEQFERLQEQFYENFSGSNNSGKPLILEGGLKWQETSNSERFEKFIELKDSLARDIAVAFNIPPQLLGISGDNTYSNMQEARLALWEENIIPLLDKYSDALGSWLSYWYQEDLIVDFDKEAISVLTKRREGLWSKISSANFMTVNEKRKLVGLAPLEGFDKINTTSQTN